MTKLIFILMLAMVPPTFMDGQETINHIDANGKKQGRWVGKYPGGSIRYDGLFINDVPTGEWQRFHENGRIKAHLFHFPNTNIVAAELFDTGGILYARGNYKGTVKDSTWDYYNNLRLVGKEDFSDGLKNGKSFTFFENGNPATESNWVNGKLNGVSISFYPSGKKKSEIMYIMGKRNGADLSYYESGQIMISGRYDNNLFDGIWKFVDPKGVVKYKLIYKAGVLLTPEVADSIEAGEFKAFDRARGRLKDPGEFIRNPEEFLKN
jgi:antitoxin component YwqK of YwqJK toxin-antitoxin module